MLWLEHGNQLTLFAIATSDKLYLEKSMYVINVSASAKFNGK